MVIGHNFALARCWLSITFMAVAMHALPGLAAAQQQAAEAHVAYRLVEETTRHFSDAQKAQQHSETLRKLGCEVSHGGHEGHSDITYRCSKWRVLPLAKEGLAHQWEAWLKEAGFETLHGHGGDDHEHGHDHAHEHGEAHDHAHEAQATEEILYRLSTWLTVHPRQETDAQELLAIAKGLGCEVRESQHAGHHDVSISCPEWKHAEFPTHEAAEAWQQWLTKNGFDTRHAH